MLEIQRDNLAGFAEVLEAILSTGAIWFAFMLPFIILSLLNRFFFGKTVGVVNEEGLALENDYICWNDIREIVYCPRMLSRFRMNYTYATFCVNPTDKIAYTIEVMHFPLYGLRKIKKAHSAVRIKVDKEGIGTILFFALLPAVLFIAVFFFSTIL